MDKLRTRNDSGVLCRLRRLSPVRPPLASQLNPILAYGLVALALQVGIAPGLAADHSGGVLQAQVPIAIPIQDNKTPQAPRSQVKQPETTRTPPVKPSPVKPSSGAADGKSRVITPTTGHVSVESDLQQADNTTGIVTATGNVRIVYPDQRVVATARQAQYYTKEGRVVLSGDVDVIQADGHTIKAEQVVYDVNRERISAVPPAGGQVFTLYRMTPSTPASDSTKPVTGRPTPGVVGIKP